MTPNSIRKILVLALISLHLVAGASSVFCVHSGKVPPSNFELVSLHQQIIVARAGPGAENASPVDFEVVQTLKGPAVDSLSLRGYYWQSPVPFFDRSNRIQQFRSMASEDKPINFSTARLDNGCNNPSFVPGQYYLLFLDPVAGLHPMLKLVGTRVREQVSWPKDPWIRAVEGYVEIWKESDPIAALNASLRQLEKEHTRPHQKADIDRHFCTPSLLKPLQKNRDIFNASTDAIGGSHALWAIVAQDPDLARSLIEELLTSSAWTQYAEPISQYLVTHRRAEYLDVLFKTAIDATDHRSRNSAIFAFRELSDQRRTSQILAIANLGPGYASASANWLVANPSKEGRRYLENLYESTTENRGWIALTLASLGSEKILDQSIATIKQGDQFLDPFFSPPEAADHYLPYDIVSDSLWIAYEAVSRSPLARASRTLRRIIRDGTPEQLGWVADGLSRSRSPWQWDRVEDVIDRSDRGQNATLWLGGFLRQHKEHPRVRALLKRLESE